LRSFEGLLQLLTFTGREWGVERNRWIFIVLGRCEGIVLSLRLEAKARLIAGQYFFDPSFLKGCAQITTECQRVLVKVFPSSDYIFQASEEKAQLISRSQVNGSKITAVWKIVPLIFSRSVCLYPAFLMRLWVVVSTKNADLLCAPVQIGLSVGQQIDRDRNFMRKNKANYAGKNRKIMRCDAVIIPRLCCHYAGSNSMYLRIFR